MISNNSSYEEESHTPFGKSSSLEIEEDNAVIFFDQSSDADLPPTPEEQEEQQVPAKNLIQVFTFDGASANSHQVMHNNASYFHSGVHFEQEQEQQQQRKRKSPSSIVSSPSPKKHSSKESEKRRRAKLSTLFDQIEEKVQSNPQFIRKKNQTKRQRITKAEILESALAYINHLESEVSLRDSTPVASPSTGGTSLSCSTSESSDAAVAVSSFPQTIQIQPQQFQYQQQQQDSNNYSFTPFVSLEQQLNSINNVNSNCNNTPSNNCNNYEFFMSSAPPQHVKVIN